MPTCQDCGSEAAPVHLTTVHRGAVRQQTLCAACAAARGVRIPPAAALPLAALVPDAPVIEDLSVVSPAEEPEFRAWLRRAFPNGVDDDGALDAG